MFILQQLKPTELLQRDEYFDPNEFFKSSSEVFVEESFKQKVLSCIEPVDCVPAATLGRYEIVIPLGGFVEIGAELPKDEIFKANIFCAYLAQMIECQSNGGEGALLNNGSPNYFYLGVGDDLIIGIVGWSSDGQKWYVDAELPYDMNQWDKGSYVFSLTADSVVVSS